MKTERRRKFSTQIVYIFLITFVSLFLVNIIIFRNMRMVIDGIDSAYDGNRNLTEMREWLDTIHSEMREYLNVKDEGVLNQFYINEERFKEFLKRFNHEGAMSEIEVREKGVYNLSIGYIQYANKAVLAKKSGEVGEYQTIQEQAEKDYEYLTTAMTNLNNLLFRNNSGTYGKMTELMHISEVLFNVILVLTGGVDICILLLLLRRLTKPLKALVDKAKEVGEGNLDVQLVEPQNYNEIGIVNSSFNQMVISLKDYMEQVRVSVEAESALREKSIRMEASVKDAQLKYLQAQINPHFLFNTLNAGAQLAMLENADQTYRYIHKVADFFRFKVKNDEGISTIREELQIVDDYMYILNVRYAGELHYNKNIDEQYMNICVPSMILQPIVENCVKHGLHDVEWEKKIDVSVTGEDDNIVISVSDNGVGIPQDIIDKIMNNTLKDEDYINKKDGIGLDNVITRLKTFYDQENVIEITSVGPDMGAEIALFIPKEKQDV
ncbi:Histidine kinase-, DNA gyrase B-, and HSP90-like ATPase [Eubacterium ruminantium]|nr:Histidine kinase-, DNA gyrase B-, and HSP90-like ATPase [Eubacterium ruminantium]